jgi:phenylalanine-4-hydroxylase
VVDEWSPTGEDRGMAVSGALDHDHPGFADPEYRARRDAIAAASAGYRRGSPIPTIAYTSTEHDVWRTVSRQLAPKHERYACAEYRAATARLALPTDEVPQLAAVSERLRCLTRFEIAPVPGLVPVRTFYGSLADRTFLSTQYVRHHSVPLYTPEPDIIHEVIGHANFLASPRMTDLYQAAGQASRRARTDAALDFFSRVFWFSIEFGVAWEDGELRTYGSGILSSFGELDRFREAEIRPFDLRAMGTQDYDIAVYQPVLFAAPSFDAAVDELRGFFDSYDDSTYERLYAPDAA